MLLQHIATAMVVAGIALVTGDVYPQQGEKCATVRALCPADDKYQTFDGSCNNLKYPTWGLIGTPHPRLLPAEYGDSVGSPRMFEHKRKLPSTRTVSNVLKNADPQFSSKISHMHVLFGQLLAHDIVHTPIVKNSDGTKLNCSCDSPHHECINIMIENNDEQYLQENKKCLKLARARPAVGLEGCNFSQREQTNALSSVIDATFVYGKTTQEARDLRVPYSAQLKTKENPIGGPHKLLPTQNMLSGTGISGTTDCPVKVHKPVEVPCFVAGDVRNNENTGLASIQTVWMRYHNKIAKEMELLNPGWSSDKVFNESRRIIAAKTQIITYKEYLPLLLGPIWMKRLELNLADVGYWNGYDDRYNPSITNEFTTAAFRFGHSQVAASLSRPGSFFQKGKYPDVQSEDSWFNSEPLLNRTGGGVGSIMRGFMIDRAEGTDPTLTNALRNQLFTEFGEKFGSDLFAINTQRGRDHGFSGYNDYRALCGLARARTFSELSSEISPSRLMKLSNVYSAVDDIDLYPGGLAENHVEGGEVGPTFACILAYGFRALRKGDRYWHEHEFSPFPFTQLQLVELRKISFAKILCDTGDDMKYVMTPSMKLQSRIVSCSGLPKFDLSAWRDMTVPHWQQPVGYQVEWTPWFVTTETSEKNLDLRDAIPRIKARRPDDICSDGERMNAETRRVPRDPYLQVRFSCKVGTIFATDFPRQLSDQTYWSQWVVPRSGEYVTDQSVYVTDFYCGDVIAIQAQTVDKGKFARETGDVFEDYGITRGFVCRDSHQQWGKCQRYQVRALCTRTQKSPTMPLYPPPREKMPTYSPNPQYPRFGRPRPYPFQGPGFSRQSAPMRYRSIARDYCFQYGVCCEFGVVIYRRAVIPSHISRFSKIMCSQYRICCDF